jgi:hypothetical protein
MYKRTFVPRSGNYLQFPLCALAYGKSEEERLNAIICYGLVETGRVFWSKCSDGQRAGYLNTWAAVKCLPDDFDHHNPLHAAAVLGAHIIGITIPTAVGAVAKHQTMRRFYDRFQTQNGTDALVRLRRDLVFEARDGKGITPRELAVLAAIYSVIGKKSGPVRITRKTISFRALGYRSEAIARKEYSRRTDGAHFLTDWKLRSTLNSLAARKFFIRRTFGRRQTYYTNRLDEAQFCAKLIALKTRRIRSKLAQTRKDKHLTDTIRKLRQTPEDE